MPKKMLTAEQIREEVRKRIIQNLPASGHLAEISVSLPKAHASDGEARNWDIEETGPADYGAYVRRVVDEARKEFLLSDAVEREQILGDFFAHS